MGLSVIILYMDTSFYSNITRKSIMVDVSCVILVQTRSSGIQGASFTRWHDKGIVWYSLLSLMHFCVIPPLVNGTPAQELNVRTLHDLTAEVP